MNSSDEPNVLSYESASAPPPQDDAAFAWAILPAFALTGIAAMSFKGIERLLWHWYGPGFPPARFTNGQSVEFWACDVPFYVYTGTAVLMTLAIFWHVGEGVARTLAILLNICGWACGINALVAIMDGPFP